MGFKQVIQCGAAAQDCSSPDPVVRIHTHETAQGATREDIGVLGSEITLRVVTGLRPGPQKVAIAVHDAVTTAVSAETGIRPDVTVDVTDVSGPLHTA